jgi:hypothetical protein
LIHACDLNVSFAPKARDQMRAAESTDSCDKGFHGWIAARLPRKPEGFLT